MYLLVFVFAKINPPPSAYCLQLYLKTLKLLLLSKKVSLKTEYKFIIMLYGHINIDREILSGTPVFNGTRVPIKNLFDYIEGGEDLTAFLDDFPSVSKTSAIAVLEMAKQSLTTEKVLNENFA